MDNFKDQIQKDVLEATVKAVQQKIAGLTCPVHHESPRLKFSEDSGPGKQKMFFDCCCSALSDLLQEALQK